MTSALAVYLPVQLVLLAAAIAGPQLVRGVLSVIVVVIGTVTLTVSVARRRPQPPSAWWLVVAAAWTLIAQALSVVAVYGGPTGMLTINALVPLLIGSVPFPLLAAGLFVLSRVTGRRGPVDAIDAAMIALAGFLLIWAFAFDEVFTISARFAIVAVLLPFGALLAFAMGVKVALGGGLRDPPTALLVVGVVVLLVVTLENLTRGIGQAALRTSSEVDILWAIFGLLLGVIGLLRSFTRPRRRAEVAAGDMSTARLLVFSIVVLVPLVAWIDSIFGVPSPDRYPAVVVTMVVSAVFLVCLVARLALLARLAQRRADELAASRDQLRYQATHDALTGLANRKLLTESLTASRQARRPVSEALLMLDLDDFKHINDSYGHPVGDELLTQTAQRLRAAAPDTATLARLGGDEFVILFENADRDAAALIANRVVDALREPYDVDSKHLQVSASVGVVVVKPGQALSSTEMLRNAAVALYQAKQAGRDRAVIRDPGPSPSDG